MSKLIDPKSNIGDVFTKQIQRLADHAFDEELTVSGLSTPFWYRPVPIDDDDKKGVFDIEKHGEDFTRKQQSEEFDKVVTDTSDPGSVGDLNVIEKQGGFMFVMERAYRARHHSICRTAIQPGGRKAGHSFVSGSILGGLAGAVAAWDKQNKGENLT